MKNLERPMKYQRNKHGGSYVDFINRVPDDCLGLVFSFLSTKKDRLACSAVSRRWFYLQLKIATLNLRNTNRQITPHEVSRNLPESSDLRLAAMLIGINYDEILTSLSIVPQLGVPFQSNGCYVTDLGITMVTGVCTRLRAISLCNCTRVGNSGIASIANNCSSLERLELTNSWLVTDEGLTLLLMKCSGLSALKLNSCCYISNRSLEAIARYSTNLKSLELVKLPLVEGSGVLSILLNRLHLETFKIAFLNLSDNVLCLSPPELPFLTELKNLSIQNPGQDLTDKGLRCLIRLALIENLYLEGLEFAISISGLMQILAHCHQTIKSFELVRCITCKSKIFLPDSHPGKHKFLRLQSVTLRQCSNINDESLYVLAHSCLSIMEVNLVGLDSITNRGIISFMQNLHNFSKVCKIEIAHCAKISNPSVWAITRTCGSKLKSLIIRNCKLVTDHGVSMIGARCPKLINLDLGGTSIGDAGVQKIVNAGLFYLEELSLRKCTEITDASLVAIANAAFLISLERVGVSGCTGLSKKGLELLECMAYELI